jgi:hypothetical protein
MKNVKRLKKGSSTLEFLLVIPVVFLAANVAISIGVLAYSKVAAQSVAYSGSVMAARRGLSSTYSQDTGSWSEAGYQQLWDHIMGDSKCLGTRASGECSRMSLIIPGNDYYLGGLPVLDDTAFLYSPFISDKISVLGQ